MLKRRDARSGGKGCGNVGGRGGWLVGRMCLGLWCGGVEWGGQLLFSRQWLVSCGKGENCLHFDLKLVSVKLVGLGRALPTLSLGLAKSAFLLALLRADEPMLLIGIGQSYERRDYVTLADGESFSHITSELAKERRSY